MRVQQRTGPAKTFRDGAAAAGSVHASRTASVPPNSVALPSALVPDTDRPGAEPSGSHAASATTTAPAALSGGSLGSAGSSLQLIPLAHLTAQMVRNVGGGWLSCWPGICNLLLSAVVWSQAVQQTGLPGTGEVAPLLKEVPCGGHPKSCLWRTAQNLDGQHSLLLLPVMQAAQGGDCCLWRTT